MYRPPVDRIPTCIARGWCTCLGGAPAWGVHLPGGCTCWGLYLPGGICLKGCTCQGLGGLPAGGTCLEGGYLTRVVYLPRECTCPRGYTCPSGGVPAQGRYLPRYSPPMNKITATCKNITLPQTSFSGGNKIKELRCETNVLG